MWGPEVPQRILENVKKERERLTVFPPDDQIFRAFELCPFESVKVVLLGQDPYHGEGQANGLSFSVKSGIKLPPSLVNIYKEYEDDIGVKRTDGDLSDWAKNGVLLLNSTLTVTESKPNSHKDFGWQQYTDSVIKYISDNNNNVVFLLWGNYAKSKTKLIDQKKHHVLTATHPSPLGANKGGWFGCKHFSRVNMLVGERIFF